VSLHSAKTRKMLSDLKNAFDHMEHGRPQEGYDLALQVQAAASAEGINSPMVKWLLAASADLAGDVLSAARFIEEAVALDPLSIPAARSVSIIGGRLREGLLASDFPENKVDATYKSLLRLGEADVVSHVAYARHISAAGRAAEAMDVLAALTKLSADDLDEEAWALIAEVAGKLGKTELAAEARSKAGLGRGDKPVQFPQSLAEA